MRKVLYLLGEPLDIQTLYEQSIYIVLRFKNGEVRKDMTGFDADLAVWLNQGVNLIEGSTQSGAITFASTANDAILDEMRIFIDFIGTNTVCPAPYSYNYRLNIEKDNIDTFALNGKFVMLDVAPDDFEISNAQPSMVTFTQSSVTVSVQTMDVAQLRNEALAFRNQAAVFKDSASSSATTATAKATEASNSATSASNSATVATTKAGEASTSATNASTSASNASTSATNAQASAEQSLSILENIGNIVDGRLQVVSAKASVAMPFGTPVYVIPAGNSSSNALVAPASASSEATSSKTLGFTIQPLSANGLGDVCTHGELVGFNTSTATQGDPVYLGATAGTYVFGLANKPIPPLHAVYLGVVTHVHATQGKILVNVQNGFEIDELHDVLIANKQDGDIIQYEASSGLYKNKPLVQATGASTTEIMSQKAVTDAISFIPKIVTKNYSQLNVVNNQSKPRANYPVNNWVFIPTRSVATQDGYIDSVSINLTNAQANRTVKVIILDKSGTSFTTRVISDAVLAEVAGTQTLTLTSALQVAVGQYIGFQVTTSNTANSVGFIDSGGLSYTDWGGWSANNPTINVGGTFVGDVQSDKRLFDFVSNFYVNVNTLDAPSKSEFNALNASTVKNADINPTLIKSPESIVANVVNNLITVGRGTRLSYGISANLFIPILPATTDLSVIQFSVDLVNIQVGRTIQFYVLSKSGTTFTIKYISSVTPAELAGINVLNLTSVVKILSGDFIGVKVTTADTAKSIAYISTGGPHYADFGGWKVSIPPSNVGDTISNPPTEPDSRGFVIQAVGYAETYVRSNHRNVANGFVGLNSSNRIPNNISKESDYWAGKKIVWVGTSIPAGGTEPYPNLVGKMLNCTVDNQAVGSSGMIWNGTRGLTLSATIAELTAVFGGAYAPQSYQNKVIGKGADLLVIDHGYNDSSSSSGANLGSIDSTDKSTFYGSFNFVIQQALLDNPLLKIMFVTPPNRYEAVGANSGYTIVQIDNVRTAIFNLAKKYNAPVCDLAYISNIHSLNYTNYKSDGVHPLDADRPRLASILYNSILEIA